MLERMKGAVTAEVAARYQQAAVARAKWRGIHRWAGSMLGWEAQLDAGGMGRTVLGFVIELWERCAALSQSKQASPAAKC